VALSNYFNHIINNLGYFVAVNYLPWLIVSPSTNTTFISECVSMDFPLLNVAIIRNTTQQRIIA